MAIEIKTWEIINGQLIEIKTSMTEHDRREKDDLEQWIKSEQSILGTDIKIIGEQVRTASGPLDYLGIDDKGNLVIIELKRDRLPREALAQAIDYASDVAKWEIDTISEVCLNYTGQSIEDFISENFEEVDRENITINQIQRITLVGFAIESSLILHRTNLGLAYCQITCYPTTGGNGYGNVQHQKKPNGGGTAELWFTASVAR
jgi:hypothetical protein